SSHRSARRSRSSSGSRTLSQACHRRRRTGGSSRRWRSSRHRRRRRNSARCCATMSQRTPVSSAPPAFSPSERPASTRDATFPAREYDAMTTTAPVARETIATRLAAFAARDPRRPAIVDRDRTVSYGELDRDASAIARTLAAIDGARGGNVCLLLGDRVSAITGIAGVARSGAAYVPFDPADPEERLRFMLADAAPAAVITEPSHVDAARALAPAGCAIVDIAAALRDAATGALPAVDGNADAHLYYTSGSTGQSKGVRQTHANQLHFVDAYARNVGINEGDRLSLLYSIGFAAGIGGVYRGIALGTTLCLYDLRRDGIAGLADWLDRERLTMLHTFAMVFREMAKRIGAKRVFPHLGVLHLGGESMYAGDVDLYRAHTTPRCRLVHQFSATE